MYFLHIQLVDELNENERYYNIKHFIDAKGEEFEEFEQESHVNIFSEYSYFNNIGSNIVTDYLINLHNVNYFEIESTF